MNYHKVGYRIHGYKNFLQTDITTVYEKTRISIMIQDRKRTQDTAS